MAKSAKKRAKELARELERELALVAGSGDDPGHGSGMLPLDAAFSPAAPPADQDGLGLAERADASLQSPTDLPEARPAPEGAPRDPTRETRKSGRKAKPDRGLAPERQSDGAPTALALAAAALSPEMEAYLAKCEEKIGFVPNVLVAYAHDDAKLQAFATFYNDLMLAPSGLSKLEREMIAVAVSAQNRCYYCLSAHGAAVRQLSGDPVLGELLVMNYRAARLAPRHRAMLDFAVKLTDASHAIEESDREALRTAGLSDRDIWDVGAVASFFNMTNRMASAVDMRPNAEYHAQAR